MNLKRKVGPLPLWGWVAIGGGTIGMIILVKRAKGKTPSSESEPIPSSLASPFGPETAGAGGGAPPLPETAKTEPPTSAPPAPAPERSPVGEFLLTEHELEEGGWERAPASMSSATPPPVNPASSAAATHAARINSQGGNPRKGLPFKLGHYKGQAAHIYSRAVHGGVGPGHNVIVVGHAGGKTHAAKPNHAPHHVKPKPKAHARKAPAPSHHPHASKPRRRASARRR